jgi:hypothetical protein
MENRSERKISYVVASDVNPRDGIGLETYIDGSIVMEIFRDDTERRTYMTLFSRDVDLDVLEASIEKFKERIDVDYIVYPNE